MSRISSRSSQCTTKADIQADRAANPPLGTNLPHARDRPGLHTLCQTSGTSTGEPMAWVDTPESWEAMLKCWQHIKAAGLVKGRDRIFFAFSFGPFLWFLDGL